MKVIEINDLSFRYDKTSPIYALDKVSLYCLQGEYVSLIGHNGSGKSTLSKLIMGLLESESGEIKIYGETLNEKTIYKLREHIGIVFQNPDNQFIGATVEDDIAFGLENKCVSSSEMPAIILEKAKEVGMENFLTKEPSALSGGQKQRVAIASTLALGSDIIILDEATSMLDPRGKSEIIALIHKLKKENPSLTILSITHDVEEAYLSDRVIVLNQGKVVFNDKPNKVFDHQDELVKMGLTIPFSKRLENLLKDENINIDAANEQELKEKLCR